jgi:hypothetical protein
MFNKSSFKTSPYNNLETGLNRSCFFQLKSLQLGTERSAYVPCKRFSGEFKDQNSLN